MVKAAAFDPVPESGLGLLMAEKGELLARMGSALEAVRLGHGVGVTRHERRPAPGSSGRALAPGGRLRCCPRPRPHPGCRRVEHIVRGGRPRWRKRLAGALRGRIPARTRTD